MTRRRVVVTGMGAVSPIGCSMEEILSNLKKGYCAVGPITHYDTTDREVKLACEVRDFNFRDYIGPKDLKRMDKVTAFTICAGKLAYEDSGLTEEIVKENTRVNVYVSTGIGGVETIEKETLKGEEKGFDRISPFFTPIVISNMSAAQLSIALGINGASNCPVTACAGGTNALGDAFRSIRDGYADVSFAGGSEASITRLAVGGFTSMKALTVQQDPNRASIPFDAERSGFVMGEGSAILVLEELEHAKARGAKIYGEIVGYAFTSDANHITAPNEDGKWAAIAMKEALADGDVAPEQIDYINAHGTSTGLNDSGETKAVKLAFGDHAYKLKMSSSKSMTGHLLGAAGALEAIICLLAMEHSYVPPTINYRVPDPACDLNIVPNEGLDEPIEYSMSNSLGFGGHNGSLVMKRWSE
ncbi:MAG: beta-ketoacyl-ACP synthase II [Tissierellia bacterium]|nr:beta-ketoacyl-ACP synthase II [Tissierellia bacterium]